MKKSLLLGAALVSFMASAQTVQNIPNAEPLQISDKDGWSVIEIATMPEPDADGNPVAPKDRTKTDADGVWQFDNMCDRDVATLKLNNTKESLYVVRFETGTKNDGSTLHFEILDASRNVEWDRVFNVVNNAQWNKFISTMTFIDEVPLTVGEKTFRITFNNENGGTTNVANLRKIIFEPREELINYALYTYIEPGNEAGRITRSPDQEYYLAGTEIALTAVANSGWKFNHWEDSYGDVYTDNPYTIVLNEIADITAYYDEVKMDSDVPGYVNLDSRTSGKGSPETKAVSLNGESYNEGVPVMYLANYRHGDYEEFDINVTRAGTYEMKAPTSTKQEKAVVSVKIYDKAAYDSDPEAAPEYEGFLSAPTTGNWQKFVDNGLEDVTLTEGKKVLRLDFSEEVATKYTANILYIGFGIDGDFGQDGIDVVEAEAAEGTVKAYDLRGIEVRPDTKGLIIINNKKVVNK